jgi:hypothetical protein
MHDREEEDDEDEKRFVEMQRAAANLPPRSRGKARKEVFVKVPLWWMEQVAHVTRSPQTFVCVWLLHLSWEAKSLTFPVPNGRLGKRGADRRMKRRALASLEAAGLITVDRQHGKTPIVTLALL